MLKSFKAFVTGSRKYGKPKKTSDIDLVVYLSEEDFYLLEELADPEETVADSTYDVHTLRFGNLNLLICTDPKTYRSWKEGTAKLIKMAEKRPVSRQTAIGVFRTLREKYGVGKK